MGTMSLIEAKKVSFEYIRRDEEGAVEGITRAVDNVSFDVKQGEFIAILGHNGSGKSTLAKHFNAILYPTEGTLLVDGKDTTDASKVMDIRQTAGMVFQNPDNQIIGQVVEEDVGFGPENIGVVASLSSPNAGLTAEIYKEFLAVEIKYEIPSDVFKIAIHNKWINCVNLFW